MNLKDSVQLEFGSVIGLLKREMESGPITNLYLNLIRSKQLARECKQTACEPSLSSIFVRTYQVFSLGLVKLKVPIENIQCFMVKLGLMTIMDF